MYALLLINLFIEFNISCLNKKKVRKKQGNYVLNLYYQWQREMIWFGSWFCQGGCGGERSAYQVASSPPFYCGSPPSRASNPVVQDAQFGSEMITPLPPSPLSPSSSSARKGGGFVRMKFGHKPATVRIEGFDCLSRDRRNCSISAVA